MKFSTAAVALVHVDGSVSVPIRVSDSSAKISESGPMPSGLSFHAGQGGTAAIVGIPGNDAGGHYRLRLTAASGSNRVSQDLALSVAEAPYFPSIDDTSFGANEYHSNQAVIVATGYPMPRLSYTGTLPDGFTLTLTSSGMATISGSPGSFEGPCSSQITMHAVSSSGAAELPVTIKLGDWRCPWNAAGALGHTIISKIAGRAGKWLWKNGKRAGAWVWKYGRAVVRSPVAEGMEEDG